MSWRADLRPASWRGVRFEARSHGLRGSRRGAHHKYPDRDQGWVEDLGLDDDALSFDAYVIGDDYMDQRDRLLAALREPGKGTLIHPWLGAMDVVVDPNGGWSIDETSQRGRMARFSLSFVAADDNGSLPDDSVNGPIATAAAASDIELNSLDALASRIDLSGAQAFVNDIAAAFNTAFAQIDDVRAIVSQGLSLQRSIVGVIFGAVARAQSIAGEFLAVRDSVGAVGALFSAVASGLGGRSTSLPVPSQPGQRPPARRPGGIPRRPEEAERAMKAILSVLDTIPPPPRLRASASTVTGNGGGIAGISGTALAATGSRISRNRAAFNGVLETILVTELARAVVDREYDSHTAARSALREAEARIEVSIRREADGLEPSDAHVRRLTDLRSVLREAVIARAATLAPIATVDLGQSMPALEASWYLSGDIAASSDLIARNGVTHPLWLPRIVTWKVAA